MRLSAGEVIYVTVTETPVEETEPKRRGRKLCVSCNERARASSRKSDNREDNLCVDCFAAELSANKCPACEKKLDTKTHLEKCRLAPQV